MATIDKLCIDCGKHFQFRPTEQDFFRKHEYADPKRCIPCRRAYRVRNGKELPTTPDKCLDCNPKLVRGVITDAEQNCLACTRHIDKSISQYPVLAQHLRGEQNGSA